MSELAGRANGRKRNQLYKLFMWRCRESNSGLDGLPSYSTCIAALFFHQMLEKQQNNTWLSCISFDNRLQEEIECLHSKGVYTALPLPSIMAAMAQALKREQMRKLER